MPQESTSTRQPRKTFGWKVVISPWGIVLGIGFSLAMLVLLQQYGATALTNGGLLLFLVIGVLLGVFVPTLSRGIAVTMVNHRRGAEATRQGGAQ